MTTKPKALELADYLVTAAKETEQSDYLVYVRLTVEEARSTAAELLRQHEVIGELVRLGAAVLKELDEDQPDAPGHSHRKPGVWDDENEFRIAGQPCQWCATWGQFRALLNKHKE